MIKDSLERVVGFRNCVFNGVVERPTVVVRVRVRIWGEDCHGSDHSRHESGGESEYRITIERGRGGAGAG